MGRVIDSHVHLDLTFSRQPERVDWMKKHHYLPISWAFGANIHVTDDLIQYLQLQKKTIHGLANTGFECYYLTGIHPRNIPNDLDLGQIPTLLAPYLEDPLCRGIGEIGLETGSDQEVDVLVAQLGIGNAVTDKNKIFGIHTPRSNKEAVTRQLLTVLDPFVHMKAYMVVDHCTPETIGEVLKRGYWAGITASPIKSSEADIIEILNAFPNHHNRIMINTDSGGKFFEDVYQLSKSANIEDAIKQQILNDNAASFFRL